MSSKTLFTTNTTTYPGLNPNIPNKLWYLRNFVISRECERKGEKLPSICHFDTPIVFAQAIKNENIHKFNYLVKVLVLQRGFDDMILYRITELNRVYNVIKQIIILQ